jgi:shikimate dehydrogenase
LTEGVMAQTERFLLAGVMGWPVMHSRSPKLHNYWLAQYGLAGTYVPLAIKTEGLGAALRALAPLGFSGVNLTIPHKEAAMALVDRVEDAARAIGAINCVTVGSDGSLSGANYDGFGFVQSVVEAVPAWRADAGPAVVIGAGGGARAVVFSLIERGAREIRLVNRTAANAERLASDIAGPIEVVQWEGRESALPGASMVVNTTSQGMIGQMALDLPLDALPRDAVVADIDYAPLDTPLLKAAKARGNTIDDGLGMLIHQARPAFKAWFGVMPEVTPALRQLMLGTL